MEVGHEGQAFAACNLVLASRTFSDSLVGAACIIPQLQPPCAFSVGMNHSPLKLSQTKDLSLQSLGVLVTEMQWMARVKRTMESKVLKLPLGVGMCGVVTRF